MIVADDIRSATEVRNHWSDTLNAVEQGCAVTITRHDHKPVTIVGRDRYIELMQRVEELSELVELYELLSDPEIRAGLEEAEAQINDGEGLSFEEAFGTTV